MRIQEEITGYIFAIPLFERLSSSNNIIDFRSLKIAKRFKNFELPTSSLIISGRKGVERDHLVIYQASFQKLKLGRCFNYIFVLSIMLSSCG